ncbi:MAG: Uma2 family endonuclease [Deferribacteres bacterium]|nr:Uma2 family endonuclease [Deferribacteres bacterium]
MPLAKKSEGKYTYADYLSWPADERWEIIDGAAYDMTPAPSTSHQEIVLRFSHTLRNNLTDSPCRVFIAPTDVVLSEHDIVQPDVFVVCDIGKITEANIQGPPDLIIEVLSPATVIKDKREKKSLYEKYRVKEYIIVDPIELYVERFCLKQGKYTDFQVFGPQETLPLCFSEGMEIFLSEVFEVAKKRNRR